MKGLEGRPDTPDSDFVGCDERGLDCAPLSVTEGLWVSCSTVLLGNSVAVINLLLLKLESADDIRLWVIGGEAARKMLRILGSVYGSSTSERSSSVSGGR